MFCLWTLCRFYVLVIRRLVVSMFFDVLSFHVCQSPVCSYSLFYLFLFLVFFSFSVKKYNINSGICCDTNYCIDMVRCLFIISEKKNHYCSDLFTILGLWVLGLAVSHINESNCNLMSPEHYFS